MFQWLLPVSMSLFPITTVVSFIWREYSVTQFETKPLYLVLHFLHFAVVLSTSYMGIPAYSALTSEEAIVTQYLKEVLACASTYLCSSIPEELYVRPPARRILHYPT